MFCVVFLLNLFQNLSLLILSSIVCKYYVQFLKGFQNCVEGYKKKKNLVLYIDIQCSVLYLHQIIYIYIYIYTVYYS